MASPDDYWRHTTREGWRWEPGKHLRPTVATIVVSEPSADAVAEREARIAAGAEVVPFGFSRVLPREQRAPAEPLLWDGDDA